MTKPKIVLSKSKLKQNDQCEKILWLEVNKRDEGVWEAGEQSRFIQGRMVEQVARDHFPGGSLMDKIKNDEKITQTKKLLKTSDVIFEASFAAYKTIVQFDILIKNADGTYTAVEVKSGSSLKDDYLDDVTIQYWVSHKTGQIEISRYEVWFINSKSESAETLFTKHDATEHVLKSQSRFNELLSGAQATLLLKEEPANPVGQHCSKPYTCKFWDYCSKKVNQGPDSVLNLPAFPAKWKALEKGIDSINHAEFDKNYRYSEVNPLVAQSIKDNKLVMDQTKINETLSTWKFPLNLFDFETIMGAMPLLDGQKPFQQMVFQFSNHILQADMTVTHEEYLHRDRSNPDQSAIKAILSTLDNGGSIVVYNKSFEMTRVRELAKRHPEHAEALTALLERFVDLLDVIRDNVYHPEFLGSYSLKVVSPTLLGKEFGYTDSLIANGGEIAQYYTEMLTTTDAERKAVIDSALRLYCKYDSVNTLVLFLWLKDQSIDLKSWIDKGVVNVHTKAA